LTPAMWRNRDEPLIASAAASTENPSPTGMWTVAVLAAMAAHWVCHPRKPSRSVKATWSWPWPPSRTVVRQFAEFAPAPFEKLTLVARIALVDRTPERMLLASPAVNDEASIGSDRGRSSCPCNWGPGDGRMVAWSPGPILTEPPAVRSGPMLGPLYEPHTAGFGAAVEIRCA
jgi:hypothetical protein